MNRPMLAAIAVALLSSGCVVRASGPRVIVTDPVPPPVVYAPPQVVVATPPPVVVAPVVVHPPVLISAPRVVIVPGTQVYTVPTASYNVFVYGGQYYSFHHGTWFHSPRHGAAWTPVAIHAVPAQVRSVPAKHWKIPPGQEKHGAYDRPDDKTVIIDKSGDKRAKQDDKRVIVEKQDDKRADRDDKDDSAKCPPGQSKKGKC